MNFKIKRGPFNCGFFPSFIKKKKKSNVYTYSTLNLVIRLHEAHSNKVTMGFASAWLDQASSLQRSLGKCVLDDWASGQMGHHTEAVPCSVVRLWSCLSSRVGGSWEQHLCACTSWRGGGGGCADQRKPPDLRAILTFMLNKGPGSSSTGGKSIR